MFSELIKLELESIKINKELINSNVGGRFVLNNIIVKEAKLSIEESKNAIIVFANKNKK